MFILGLSFYYHDSALVLLRDGEVIFAAQEERYTRKKHDESFPANAVRHALAYAGITIDDIAAVGFYEKPLLKFFDRILPMYLRVWPRGLLSYHKALQEWLQKKLWIPQTIQKELKYMGEILYVPHHESHAASAYYVSGFDNATVVTADGVGEWSTTTVGLGQGNDLELKEEIRFPHSLGLLYSALTYYLGFTVNSAEYKVMGLAPYGEPRYMDQLRELIDIKDDGSFRLNMRYFCYEYGLRMTGRRLERLFDQPRRIPESPLTQFHKDIARSLQEITEEAMLKIALHAKAMTGSENLCLAGGVALNCVANGKILRSGLFKEIFVQPASGDAGGALGVALSIWHKKFGGKRTPKMDHVFLGNEYKQTEIEQMLRAEGIPFETQRDDQLLDRVSDLLQGENVVGWFQGRSEFGPRALGNRSILADARNAENWQKVNQKIKFRESFRPFAPSVLEEHARDWFSIDRESPFMLFTVDVLPEKRMLIPAVTHVDGSARVQTIRRNQNPMYYDLLKKFEEKTGCPVLINTSFNVRGEPMVESPSDALHCFLHTQMEYLVLGNCLIEKKQLSGQAAL